ncbi:DUF1631 family protein [Xylophilus rhododendri]|uniref:DUF1631 family protein n=1 Tax=Xylophilus rhododendri TaxID=2697032 RepID=A0A857JCH3_9BURK|nr:DUF1631 family protein [Xylophilus rhododendri]QHJ00663.1 DUF1631 family protein [Xylophilus rhododendri]
MTIANAESANRHPLDLCIDDAVAHAGVLMAELVARARRSLYEQAHRSGASADGSAAAQQARQLLGDKASFFEDEFPAALMTAMVHPQPHVAALHEDVLATVLPQLAQPLGEFALLASSALGLAQAQFDANPFSPESVVQAMQSVADRSGAAEPVIALWMRHLCLALAPELGEEYRRLSDLLRKALPPGASVQAAAAPVDGDAAAEALALLAPVSRPPDAPRPGEAVDAAQRIAADIASWPEIENVPDTVRDFVLGPWSEVIAQAEAHAGNLNGTPVDPDGYLALVRPLFWSAQPSLGRSDVQRLLVTVPSLLSRLRSGLQSIGYPAERAGPFFSMLDDLHGVAARAAGSSFAMRRQPRTPSVTEGLPDPGPAGPSAGDERGASAAQARVSAAAASQVLQIGAQVAAWEGGRWARWELSWVSPKGKLLLFTTEDGDVDSMSRAGCIRRIVEQRMHIIPDIAF